MFGCNLKTNVLASDCISSGEGGCVGGAGGAGGGGGGASGWGWRWCSGNISKI